jgi:hypothetical protein
MNLSLQHQIGAIAGWKLELAAVKPEPPRGPPLPRPDMKTYSSEHYRGSVDASLVSHLASGSYTIVVEDVAEKDFNDLREMAAGKDLLEARLYLFWADAPAAKLSGDGLVAVLRVTSLWRRAGKWRYEMVVEGREWVYDRLMQPCPVINGHGLFGTAIELADKFVRVKQQLPTTPDKTVIPTEYKLTVAEQLRKLETQLEEAAMTATPSKLRGQLGMFLIRDGELHVGPDRISERVKVKLLDSKTGLIDLQRAGAITELGAAVGIDSDPVVERRDLFVVTMRGRPDLKPGDVVELEAPERAAFGEDLGFALGPAPTSPPGKMVTAYVQEVTHRQNREQGFTTVVRCVAAAKLSEMRTSLVDRLWMSPRTA